MEKLTRKQEIALRHEQEQAKFAKEEERKTLFKRLGIAASVAIFLFGSWWAITESMKPEAPLPGKEVESLGQDHVEDITGVTYNSNPPTSGPHFAIWAKRGVYPYQISDGHLIHALEHGYIVLSYNCAELGKPSETVRVEPGNPFAKTTFTEEAAMSPFTPETAPKKVVDLPQAFSSDSCQGLVRELSGFLDDWQRIIIVPRPGLDTKLAFTAWGRVEKMNPSEGSGLSTDEKEKINEFITRFHNAGPEKTVE